MLELKLMFEPAYAANKTTSNRTMLELKWLQRLFSTNR